MMDPSSLPDATTHVENGSQCQKSRWTCPAPSNYNWSTATDVLTQRRHSFLFFFHRMTRRRRRRRAVTRWRDNLLESIVVCRFLPILLVRERLWNQKTLPAVFFSWKKIKVRSVPETQLCILIIHPTRLGSPSSCFKTNTGRGVCLSSYFE